MGKAAAIGIFVAALFLALAFILRRKPLTRERIAAASGSKKAVLLACFSILAFLTGSSGCKPGARDATPADVQTVSQDAGTQQLLPKETTEPAAAESKAWAELSGMWQDLVPKLEEMTKLAESGKVGSDMKNEVDDLSKKHAELLEKLVTSGDLDKETADALDDVYAHGMYSLWRNHFGPTCYKMTYAGSIRKGINDTLTQRVEKLHELMEKGVINESTADKVKADMAKDFDFLKKVNEILGGGFDNDKQTKLVQKAENLYQDAKHVIAKTDPSFKTAEIIVQLMAGKPAPKAKTGEAAAAVSLAGLTPLWDKLVHYTVYESWKDDRQAAMDDAEKSKKDHAALIEKLVTAGSLDKASGETLAAVYDDMMDHLARSYAGPTCYDMTMEGQFVYEFKKSAVERLAGLEELVKKGTLTKAAADKVEAAIARDLYFYGKLLAADEEANKGTWKAWGNKVKEIQAFYEDQKHAIAKNDPSFKIADMIVNILTGGAAAK